MTAPEAAAVGPAPRPSAAASVGAAVALSLVAAYACGVTSAGLPLDNPHLWDALSRGSYLGHPPLRFVVSCAPFFLGALAVAFRVLRVRPDALSALASPWRRLAAALGPLVLSPFVLAQDDPWRRPALFAVCLGASLAVVAFVAPPPEPAADPQRPAWKEHLPVLAVIAAHFVTFSALAIIRDRGEWSATVDLGIFKEALWHTLRGRPMFSPTVGYSFLGEHFSPVLFLLVPFYALSPTSECLLLLQTLAVSAAAWPVYLVARDQGLRRVTATLLVGAMLCSPPLHTALMYDFHMDLLAVPALAWLALALTRRHFGQALVAVALLVSVKEDMFIPATGAVLAFAIPGTARDRRWGAAIVALAIGYCLFAMAVLLKRYGPPPGVPVYMSDGSEPGGYKFLRNFRHLAGPPGGPVGHLLGQPVRFVLWAFTDARLTTFLTLLAPAGFVSLFAGWRVAFLMPLGIILLSDNPEIVALRYHYSAIQHPGVYLAAAFGLAALLRRAAHPRRAEVAAGAYLVGATLTLVATHPSSMASRVHATDTRAISPHTRIVDRLAARIPADAPVSVSTWVGPRVSNRPFNALFPNGLDRADWVLVDLQRPPWPASVESRDAMLLHLMRTGFGVVAAEDGAVLMQRGHSPQGNPDAVRRLFLHRRYEVEGTEQTEFSNCSVRDPSASDGRARVVSPDDPRPGGWMVYGPFVRLPQGRYRVTFRLRARRAGAAFDEIGLVDVFRQPGVTIAQRRLTPDLFPTPEWRDVTLDFSLDEPGGAGGLEFRVRTDRNWELGADVITLSPAGDDDDALVRAIIVGG